MRNLMVCEEPDGSLVAGSVTHVEPRGRGRLTIWYGYEYRDREYYGRLDFKGSGRASNWWEYGVLAPTEQRNSERADGEAVLYVAVTERAGSPIILEGWWKGPPLSGRMGTRLSWIFRFDNPTPGRS